MEQEITRILRKLTGHDCIKLSKRGNHSILAALRVAKAINPGKKFISVADGGWITYLQYPKRLKMGLELVKTEHAKVDINDLKARLSGRGCSAFIYQNPGGYFAEQPIGEIFSVCKANGCLVIMDVTGSIGTELCNGRYADFLLASFGKGKAVNAGFGGFLSSRESAFDISGHLSDSGLTYEQLGIIKNRLEELPARQAKLLNECRKIKKDLNRLEILHANSNGMVVVVKINIPAEKKEVIDYCAKNSYEYTICPRYIRVNECAICIEVKRVD